MSGVDREAVLNRRDGGHISGVVGVDQYSHTDEDIARSVLIARKRMFTGVVEDIVHEVVFVNDHRGEIATTGLGQCEPRRFGEIDDRKAIQRVSVESDDRLFVDAGRCAVMPKSSDAPGLSLNVAKHPVRLRLHEVVRIHMNRHR